LSLPEDFEKSLEDDRGDLAIGTAKTVPARLESRAGGSTNEGKSSERGCKQKIKNKTSNHNKKVQPF
jgi:hypothetical protein